MCVCTYTHTGTHFATHATTYRISSMRVLLYVCSYSCCSFCCCTYVHPRCSARPSVAKTTLFYFLFKPTATMIMATRKWQLLRLTIENELSERAREHASANPSKHQQQSSREAEQQRTCERANRREWVTILRVRTERESALSTLSAALALSLVFWQIQNTCACKRVKIKMRQMSILY